MTHKKVIFIGFYSILIFLIYSTIPIIANSVVFSSIPLSDPANDVFRFVGSGPVGLNETGDYIDEIDIISIGIQGNNLSVEFAAPPQVKINYTISIKIDNNTDDVNEYEITGSGITFQLVRSSDLHLWDPIGSHWIFGTANLSYTITTNNLTLMDISIAIPELTSSQIMMIATYQGETPTFYYIDYAPLQESIDNGTQIPGFILLLTLFSLLVLMGIVFIKHNEVKF